MNLNRLKNVQFSSRERKVIFWLPIFLIIGFLFFRILNREQYFEFIKEDGPIEYGQFILYLICALISGKISWKFWQLKRKMPALVYLLFTLLFIFVAKEEISWG
ncbi:MAG: hypothetical protein PHX72_02900 [Candidatus Shapirobacteria bacterium]|nr:hypothetical protein [Candidatus Shapirobacteria bacterium]